MKKYLLLIAFFTILPEIGFAQNDTMGGVSTGEAKVYTSRRTTGIIDKSAPKVFEDVTSQTALNSFKCVSGGKDKAFIVEATACTVAVFDFDNDGKPDIYLVNGSTIDAASGKAKPPKSALYRNLGNWKFEDVTEKAGVQNERWGMGVSIADYNNDGYADIFVGNYGIPRLYKNNGDGTFTDVAESVGLAINGWHTGATFGDYDKDGRLDLFIPSYLEFDLNALPPSPLDAGKGGRTGNNFC
ncbi:MAG: VCBS repeat-containing protein, partial [Pyrinomonadaceae bacterium]|nr:VCBS repeat-containing protein [Pyrinomonadaceae bacterium]